MFPEFLRQELSKKGYLSTYDPEGKDFLNIEFEFGPQKTLGMKFKGVAPEVALAEVLIFRFRYSVESPFDLCSYVTNQHVGVLLEFQPHDNVVMARTYIDRPNIVGIMAAFSHVCLFGLKPLCKKVEKQGRWTPQLVDFYLRCLPQRELQ